MKSPLAVALTVFILTRLVFQIQIPLERVVIFPMALVPNVFGLWNIIYMSSRPLRYLPIGVHGAILPLIMMPIGGLAASCGGFLTFGHAGVTWFQAVSLPYPLVVATFLVDIAVYYLLWKYAVGFFNQVLGIA